MVRSRKKDEGKTYQHIGDIHWKEAKRQYYTPGLHTAGLSPEMLRKRGMRRLIRDDKNARQMMVTFDKEYVIETVFKTVVERLGIFLNEELNEEYYNFFFAELKEYALTRGDRAKREQLRTEAQRLHERFPHKTVEQWLLELSPQCSEPATADVSNELTTVNAVDEPRNTAVDDTRVQDSSNNKVEHDDEIDYETWGMSDDAVSQGSSVRQEQTDELTTTTGFESMNYDLSDCDDSESDGNDDDTEVEKPDVDSVVTTVLGQEDTITRSSADSSETEKTAPRKRGRPRKLS
ncbi:hypothetical protein NSTC745_03867 [Nostoc sp. DSM 114161]|jgi:hypothetical protein|uniref:hypothetical protein n=1 Tax=Nostoc sp. DSM 114161 TaxID=3440143 RepID=UPI00404640C9